MHLLLILLVLFFSVVVAFFAAVLAARQRMGLSARVGTVMDFILLLPVVIGPRAPWMLLAHASGRCGRCLLGAFPRCPVAGALLATLSAALFAFPLIYVATRIAFSKIHADQIDAARLLGMKRWGILFHVLIPADRTTLAIGIILGLLRILAA